MLFTVVWRWDVYWLHDIVRFCSFNSGYFRGYLVCILFITYGFLAECFWMVELAFRLCLNEIYLISWNEVFDRFRAQLFVSSRDWNTRFKSTSFKPYHQWLSYGIIWNISLYPIPLLRYVKFHFRLIRFGLLKFILFQRLKVLWII